MLILAWPVHKFTCLYKPTKKSAIQIKLFSNTTMKPAIQIQIVSKTTMKSAFQIQIFSETSTTLATKHFFPRNFCHHFSDSSSVLCQKQSKPNKRNGNSTSASVTRDCPGFFFFLLQPPARNWPVGEVTLWEDGSDKFITSRWMGSWGMGTVSAKERLQL